MPTADTALATVSAAKARAHLRDASVPLPTSGIAAGYVQANLAFVPIEWADEFEELCRANPAALPLIERLPAGSTVPRWSAREADLATDTGCYRVFDGTGWTTVRRLAPETTAAATAFVIGCSFTAEGALQEGGVHLKQIGSGGEVPIYRTNRPLTPAGRLSGHLVVSMRSIRRDQVDQATQITREFPVAHGEPVLVGPGESLGCRDGDDPDWGAPMEVAEDEVPMYWACGVTPQTVIEESPLPWAAVHAPGHMFITDLRQEFVRGRSAAEIRAEIQGEA